MQTAVITGYGPGLGEQLAARLLDRGDRVVGLSRHGRAGPSNGRFLALACDVGEAISVNAAFEQIHARWGAPSILIHNAAELLLDDFLKIRPEQFESLWRTSLLGAVHCAQAVVPHMLEQAAGTLIFSGATASVKAGPQSAAFASAKFALRGLAQSLARQYGRHGVHVIHSVIDGVIWGQRAELVFQMDQNRCLPADFIADAYMHLIGQHPSAWTHELDLRSQHGDF